MAAVLAPSNHDLPSRPTCRLSRGREAGGSVLVTVDTAKLLHVRRAIVQSGIPNVGIMKATPLACGTRVRLAVVAPAAAIPGLMERIAAAVA